MTAGLLIIASLVALLVAGRGIRCGHRHVAVRSNVQRPGPDHVGNWEVCSCRAARMSGDSKWRRHPPAFLKH